ncbi:MAG: hypothetical protein Q8Q26_18920 [Pseudorhodobacter sp.]|nr:hypothetical protein [Pseudorhodobacter sp.]
MIERGWLGRAALALAAVLVAWAMWLWLRPPATPEQLFLKRCTTCHNLPDVKPFRRHSFKGLVTTMLTMHGADRVISPAEARTIITYLEEKANP